MKLITPLSAALAVALSLPAVAETLPNGDDGVIVWRNFQLAGTTAGAPSHDMHIYFIKQWWFTPQLGAYFFYGTQQTAGARLQYKLPLLSGLDAAGNPTPPRLTLTGMAGYRAAAMGSSLTSFSSGFREGPEVALTAALPLGNGFTASAMGSYAATFGSNGAAPGSLVFYSGSLNYQVLPTTVAGVGLLGSFLAPYAGGLTFHDLGPTLTVSHKF